MMAMVYEWKPGSHVAIEAQVAGEFLERTRIINNGQLTPRAVVNAARSEASPIHSAFEWNDTVAGEKYREEQAKYLIRSIAVRLPEASESKSAIRAFVSVTTDAQRSYTSTQDALSDPEMRTQVLAQAMRELRSFWQRYKELEELADVFAAVERLDP